MSRTLLQGIGILAFAGNLPFLNHRSHPLTAVLFHTPFLLAHGTMRFL